MVTDQSTGASFFGLCGFCGVESWNALRHGPVGWQIAPDGTREPLRGRVTCFNCLTALEGAVQLEHPALRKVIEAAACQRRMLDETLPSA